MNSRSCGAWVHDQAQPANKPCPSALKSRESATLMARNAIRATRVFREQLCAPSGFSDPPLACVKKVS
jgi:hypothetical protein